MSEVKTGRLLALLCLPSCLELNPDFSADDETGGSTSQSAQSGSSTVPEGSSSSSSSSGEVCVADDLEPNEEMDDAADANMLGFVLSATLDSAFDLDWYKGSSNPDNPGELFVRVTPATFRACIYAGCNSTPDFPTIDKCSGVLDTAPNGEPGCCGPGVASIEYTCSAGLDVVFHARVDDPAAAECAPYEVEFGTI